MDAGGFGQDKSDGATTPHADGGGLFTSVSPSLDLSGSSMTHSSRKADSSQPPSVTARRQLAPTWSPQGNGNGPDGGFSYANVVSAGVELSDGSRDLRSGSNGDHMDLGDDHFRLSSENDWLDNQLDKDGLGFGPLWGSMAQPAQHSTNGFGHELYTTGTSGGNSPSNTNGNSLAIGGLGQHGGHAQRPPRGDPTHLMSADEMVNISLSFLPMMVSRASANPPFIHDQIYRCSEGDVKEPIARAMVCISAHDGAMPSGLSFVHEMIKKERDGLVKSFVSCLSAQPTGSPLDPWLLTLPRMAGRMQLRY